MLIPRRIQLQQDNDLQCFHLWSPVTPGLAALARADLKKWVAKLLRRLAGAYAVNLQGFSIQDDQFHLVLQWVPAQAAAWPDDEVWRRWLQAHPAPAAGGATPVADLGQARQRLASLSAFLQQFKQLITFQFNRETRHRGTIWKGRFRMAALKDAGALAGVLAFVDLLPVAKGDGQRPEESAFSSLHARVATYKGAYGKPPYGPLGGPDGEWERFDADIARELREGEDPLAMWLAPPPGPINPAPATPPGMPAIPPADSSAPPPPVPATSPWPGMADPAVAPMPGAGGTTPLGPMPMPATAPSPMAADAGMDPSANLGITSQGPTPGAGTIAAPDAAAARLAWLLALREDSPLNRPAPKGLLAFLPLRNYLQLLDTLVEKAKAWPHLPAAAPGRAPAPPTPAWEGGIARALAALGIPAQTFTAQWQRLARLRV